MNTDPTENIRRVMVENINSQATEDKDADRKRLETQYGEVWTTEEVSRKFVVLSFAAPFCIVREKATGKKGTIMFQHMPRFYFNFQPE